MRRKNAVDLTPLLEMLKSVCTVRELIDEIGLDDVIAEISPSEYVSSTTDDVLSQFSRRDAIDYFEIEVKD